ncbi:TPA: hypothetical protein ACIBLZ_004446 [Salmonella enterica subsp. enterica serovar Infantis]
MINISEEQYASISEKIKSMPEVIAFYRISGSFNAYSIYRYERLL